MFKAVFYPTLLTVLLSSGAFLNAADKISSSPTNYEGQLKGKSIFYSLKIKHGDNFFSFNVPEESFNKLGPTGTEKLTQELLKLYDDIFAGSYEIFERLPKGYQFNVTFGRTSSGTAFNKVYLASRISNIFPNFLPYNENKNDFTEDERHIIFHEIGHSVFAIMVGTLEHPRTKAIEEGFVEYLAGETANGEKINKIPVSAQAGENIKGLAQLDVDISVWGEETVLNMNKYKGYVGVTHHVFGLQFIDAFIRVFGKERLAEFLVRLKASETTPLENDYGTSEIKHIFRSMGYSDNDISRFETELHTALKQNIFSF